MSQFNDKSAASTGPSQASVFIWLFAIASIWHYASSSREITEAWFRFDPLRTPLLALAIVSALIGALYPQRTRAVLFFAVGQTAAIFARFPFVADHLIMELALHAGILLSFAHLAVRARSTDVSADDMFRLYAPVGRWLLIVMYFFGTFHKFNPGFMSLQSSCAVLFVEGFPLPAFIVNSTWAHYAGMYGTLILEATAMLLLLSARTKYFGMLLGMSFHFAIGISTVGTLAHFSAFALASHSLFLPSTFGDRVVSGIRLPAAMRTDTGIKALTIGIVAMQLLFAVHMYATTEGYLVNALFALFAITLLTLVALFGRHRASDAPYRLISPSPALNLIPLLYFIYCTSPYLGLGTGGSLAMFSGLRTEGGISNHYLITKPLGLFPYQDKIVYVKSASNPSLQEAAREEQGVVLFDFQRHFTLNETLVLPLTIAIDGKTLALDRPEAVQKFANEYFTGQNWLERKFMSFRLVDDPRPDRCRH
jgi:hypothetical protein